MAIGSRWPIGKLLRCRSQWSVEVVRCINEWANGCYSWESMKWHNPKESVQKWVNQRVNESEATKQWLNESSNQRANESINQWINFRDSMSQWTNESVINEWPNESMIRWFSETMHQWTNEQMNQWIHEPMNQWTTEQRDGWMNGWMGGFLFLCWSIFPSSLSDLFAEAPLLSATSSLSRHLSGACALSCLALL